MRLRGFGRSIVRRLDAPCRRYGNHRPQIGARTVLGADGPRLDRIECLESRLEHFLGVQPADDLFVFGQRVDDFSGLSRFASLADLLATATSASPGFESGRPPRRRRATPWAA
jgi:hypothetical protein